MKKILFIIALISCSDVVAQNIQILSEQDSTEVPFAVVLYVTNEATQVGGCTDEDGKFMLQIPQKTTFIEITSVGYYNKRIAVDSITALIYLKEEIVSLNEIMLKSNKKSKRKTTKLGYPIKYKYYSCDVSQGFEVITLFRCNVNKKIINFLFYLREPDIQTNSFSLFKIVFYKNKNGYPTEKIYDRSDNIFRVNSSQCGKIKVNISHLDITLSKDGLFIGLEYIGHIKENEKVINYTGKDDKHFSEEVGISFLKSKLPDAAQTYKRYKFNNKSNNWIKNERDFKLKEDEYYVPAFGIEVY